MKKFMTSIELLQERGLPTYIQKLISNNSFDENTKEKAERLVGLFQNLSKFDESNSEDDGDGDVDYF